MNDPSLNLMNPIFLIFLVFVMIQCFFFIFSLIAEAIYDFFLQWWILFFHSLIKSTLLAGKENCFLIYFFFLQRLITRKVALCQASLEN